MALIKVASSSQFIEANKKNRRHFVKMIREEDQIVQLLGNFGKWQVVLISPIFFFGIMSAMEVLVTSFLSPEVDYWCVIETPDGLVDTWQEWENLSSPLLSNGKRDKCNIFDIDYSTFDTVDSLINVVESTNRTRECARWSYDTSFYPRTIITDFDLVCGRDWYVTLTRSVFMFGFMVGVFGSGVLSDKFGRKNTFFHSSFLLCIFSLCTSFASSIEVYIFLRFCVAGTNATVFLICFVYCMEIVGGNWKTYVGVGLEFPWALGYSLLPLVAYFIPDWSLLNIAIASPMFLTPVFFYFLPESPRWLLSNGRVEEAKEILEKAVKMNKRKWPENFVLKKIEHSVEEEKEEEVFSGASVLDLFKTRNLLKKTIIQMYVWFTASFVYYGMTLNSDTLIPGDLYVNFTVGGLLEFPAYIITTILLHFVGRRWPQAGAYMLGGVSLLLTLSTSSDLAKSVLSQLGKFGVTASFAMIYVYAAELYPTVLRSTGMGISSLMARVGSILAPIVGRELGRKNLEAAIVIFGVTSVLAGILTLLLPETRGHKLPDTLVDGEMFGKDDSVFDSCQSINAAQKNETNYENAAFNKEQS